MFRGVEWIAAGDLDGREFDNALRGCGRPRAERLQIPHVRCARPAPLPLHFTKPALNSAPPRWSPFPLVTFAAHSDSHRDTSSSPTRSLPSPHLQAPAALASKSSTQAAGVPPDFASKRHGEPEDLHSVVCRGASLSNIDAPSTHSALQAPELRLRCRLYSVASKKPRQVSLATRCSPTGRYPLAESVLDEAALQPYIHDCTVHIHEGDTVHRFRIFYKRHCRLPVNQSTHLVTERALRGDAVVMRIGAKDSQIVVNMRGRDCALSDYAVKRYVMYRLSCASTHRVLRFAAYISYRTTRRSQTPRVLVFRKTIKSKRA